MKRESYIIICDDDQGLDNVKQILKVKNLGDKVVQPLHRQVSCIQGIMSQIDECYGMSYDEILELLREFYNYEVINKEDMIEPYRYIVIDLYENWEIYAQNNNYAKECDVLEVEGLRNRLIEIVDESNIKSMMRQLKHKEDMEEFNH